MQTQIRLHKMLTSGEPELEILPWSTLRWAAEAFSKTLDVVGAEPDKNNLNGTKSPEQQEMLGRSFPDLSFVSCLGHWLETHLNSLKDYSM